MVETLTRYKWWLLGAVLLAVAAYVYNYGVPKFAAQLNIVGTAQAADLGGNCCADLEDRIAELEATTARKGNRKVSLTVSGQVNYMILGWDDTLTGESDQRIINSPIDPSRITFSGKAMMQKDWGAGYVVELGMARWDLLSDVLHVNDNDVYLRQAAVFVETPAGRVYLGKTGESTRGISSISVVNTQVAHKALSLRPLVGGEGISENLDLYDGQLLDVLKWESPTLSGFFVSASWSSDGSIPSGQESVWSVALRYAGEFSGFRVAAGVGYRDGAVFPGLAPILPLPQVAFDQETISGSLSAQHVPSGIFLNIAAGQASFGSVDVMSWEVMPGIETKLFTAGKTTLYLSYTNLDLGDLGVSDDVVWYEGGLVQAIDAAAMDMYFAMRVIDAGGSDDAMTWMAGSRIKF